MIDEPLTPEQDDDDAAEQTRAMIFAAASAIVTLLLAIYGRSVAPDLTNVPLISADGRLFYLLAVASSIGVGVQIERAVRPRPVGRLDVVEPEYRGARPPLPTSWILPSLTMLGALLLVAHYPRLPVVVAAPVLAGTGVFAAMLVRHYLFSDDGLPFLSARIAHLALTYIVAFLALSLIYLFKARMLYAAPAVFLVAFLLLVQIHDGLRAIPARVVVYAAVGGIVLAEAAWGLNYWPAAGWFGGVLLSVLFLALGQITGAYFTRRLNRQAALRYAGVVAAAVVLVAFVS